MLSKFKFFVFLLIFIFNIFFIFLLFQKDTNLQFELFSVIVLYFLITGGVAFYTFKKIKFDIFEPIFLFSFIFLILFVGRPLYIVLANDYYFMSIIGVDMKYFIPVILNLSIGFFCFLIGYNINSGKKIFINLFDKLFGGLDKRIFDIKKLLFFSLLFFVIGFTTYIYFYEFRLKAIESVEAYRESTAYIYYGLDLLIPSLVLMFFIQHISKNKIWKVVFLIQLLITLYIYMGLHARYRWVALVLMLIFLHYLLTNKRPSIKTLLISLLTFSVLFPLFSVNRALLRQGVSLELIKYALNEYQFIISIFLSSHGDAAMFDFLMLFFQEIPDRVNFLFGLGFLQLLIHPIPRILWPSKPMQPSSYFMEQVLPEFYTYGTGFASSIFGDLYWNFGVLGIPIGMFFIGLLLKKIYIWCMARKGSVIGSVILACTLSYLPMYLRGEFVGTSVWFLSAFIPLLLAIRYSSRRIIT